MNASCFKVAEVKSRCLIEYYFSNCSNEQYVPLTKILEQEENKLNSMAEYYRAKMREKFEALAALAKPILPDEINPLFKLKLLVHYWFVEAMKALRKDSQHRLVKEPADDWYINKNELYEWEIYAIDQEKYYVSVKAIGKPRYLVQVLNTTVPNCFENTVIENELPGDCDPTNAARDNERIKCISMRLVERIPSFIREIQKGCFKPHKAYGDSNTGSASSSSGSGA